MTKILTEPYSTTLFNYIFANLWENICLIEYIYQNFCFHHSLNLNFLLLQQVHHLWTIHFPFSLPHMSLILWCILIIFVLHLPLSFSLLSPFLLHSQSGNYKRNTFFFSLIFSKSVSFPNTSVHSTFHILLLGHISKLLR